MDSSLKNVLNKKTRNMNDSIKTIEDNMHAKIESSVQKTKNSMHETSKGIRYDLNDTKQRELDKPQNNDSCHGKI